MRKTLDAIAHAHNRFQNFDFHLCWVLDRPGGKPVDCQLPARDRSFVSADPRSAPRIFHKTCLRRCVLVDLDRIRSRVHQLAVTAQERDESGLILQRIEFS